MAHLIEKEDRTSLLENCELKKCIFPFYFFNVDISHIHHKYKKKKKKKNIINIISVSYTLIVR